MVIQSMVLWRWGHRIRKGIPLVESVKGWICHVKLPSFLRPHCVMNGGSGVSIGGGDGFLGSYQLYQSTSWKGPAVCKQSMGGSSFQSFGQFFSRDITRSDLKTCISGSFLEGKWKSSYFRESIGLLFLLIWPGSMGPVYFSRHLVDLYW